MRSVISLHLGQETILCYEVIIKNHMLREVTTSKTTQTRVSSASFLAGQWVDFFIPGVEQVGGYSMCSAPSDLE